MRRASFLPLALALLAGCATPRGTAEEPVVTRVVLRGVRPLFAEQLFDKLATHGPDCVVWRLGCEWYRLDADALSVDKRRIEAFYRERGYYAARVESVDLVSDGAGRVRVALHVAEGKPLRVTKVAVEGLDAAPEARARAGKLALQPGDAFTEAAYDAARQQLLTALLSTGWADAKVAQEAQLLPEEGTAEVRYLVQAGERFRFGRVFVAGTAAVPRQKVIDRASREVKAGEWYDEASLNRAQSRVFDMGVFSGARVNRAPADPERRTVPVMVSVREAPFRTIRLGPGIGFQSNRWDVQGIASWTHRNWLGSLERLQLDLRAGYAWLPNPFTPTRQGVVGLVGAEFSQPGVLGDAVDLTLRVEVEKSLEEAYGYTSQRSRLGTPIRLAPRWTLVPSYNFEVYWMEELPQGSTLPPQLQNCPAEICLLSYLEQRLIWDGRDDPLVTTRGQYASLSIQEGFKIGKNGYTFLKVQPEVRHFQPIRHDTMLAARARVGALIPIAETQAAPVVALFASGGPLSMRGYGYGRLAPMVQQDGKWVPLGGNGLLEASVELRHDLSKSLGGVLFLDAGNVSTANGVPTTWREALDLTKLQLALGVGLRVRTPVGPLRVDTAMRLPTDWSAGVPFNQRFPTVPGDSGHREPIAAIHFSLGEAF